MNPATTPKKIMDITCVCGKTITPNQRWMHKACAINNNPAINAAINKANGEQPLDQPVIPVSQKDGCDSSERRTPNRRDRDAYNAYMRGYMRKRRLLAAQVPKA